ILLSAIKAGTHPLLVDSVDHWNGQYIVLDAVVPLDEFLDKHPEIKKDNWLLSLEEKTFKPYEEKFGYKYWCLPFGTTLQSFFFVRTDLLKDAGYTMDDLNKIKSFDDIREIGKALTNREKGIWGFELCGTRWDITDTIWPQWAISQDKELGKWLSDDWSETYVSEWPWVEAMKAHIDFVYDSKISSPASLKEGDEVVTELMMRGTVAMTQTEFVNIGTIMDRDRTLAKTKQPQFLKTGTIQFAPGPDMGSGIRGWIMPYGFIMLKRPEATKQDYEAAFEYMASWLTMDAQTEIQRLTGLFPASKSTADALLKKAEELIAKEDYSLQNVKALWPLIKDKCIPAPPFPAFVGMVYDIQAKWGEKAWLKELPVEEALDNAAKEIKELIKKFGFAK
ncbi:MAG: extracellular solute-binding protein, partial [Candidatus Micrarchaeia archaeon]